MDAEFINITTENLAQEHLCGFDSPRNRPYIRP